MSNIVLDVQNVGKSFVSYRSNLSRFLRWFGLPVRPVHEYWAVRDISFTLHAGEALALIGQNGAGKSTLLKLITGTLRNTVGNIAVNGRISAILELGLGFNPEFTGRQNVYLSCGLLGLSNRQIDEIIPAIEDFSELSEFFDQPLRVYSSGMQARLAFSVATAVRPDVLIVDEILSVGDSYFQHKSFDKIRQFKQQGTTILFVTHSMSDVRALCDRVILLDNGKVLKDGPPDEVVDYYNALIADKENAKLSVQQRRQQDGWLLTRSGNFQAALKSLILMDEATQESVETVRVGQRLVLKLTAVINDNIPRLVLGYMLRDRTGHVVWGTNTWHTRQVVNNLKTGDEVEFFLRFTCTLGPGSYSFSPALVSSDTHLEDNYEWVDNALVFDVINTDKNFFIGTSWLDAVFQISRR
ncbi:Teichoic acids export ATP-binding protein TagH [Sporotomaculum syntrophicum]|uniref:Teichoic acids export ATP-binding protein TagH n=1 Tax=Sporotomaculum syntrophicum TaxID=182264 RepID=A0A9D3AWY3_9FIRM|nr:ABC transporter ATP-binding protein [Sporotomaculum syntrophicum]KAF1086050.1 Teichoic acids export ATP-binding protein TagH [Sporotomaculum syntrophicum]